MLRIEHPATGVPEHVVIFLDVKVFQKIVQLPQE